MHKGMDIDTGTGDPVRAAARGVISFMQTPSQSGGYGNFICVRHTSEFVTCSLSRAGSPP